MNQDSDRAHRDQASVRGAAVTLMAQLAKAALQFASLIVLSRLLTPSDFGVLAMVLSIVGVAVILSDFGLSLAAIQTRELSAGQNTTLFWVNLAIGAIAAIGLLALSPLIADFYHRPVVEQVCWVLAFTFISNSAAVAFRVHAIRDLKFGAVALSDVLGQLVGFGIAVIAATLDFGIWALVSQQIALSVGTLVTLIALSRWVPQLPWRGESIRNLTHFSVTSLLTQLANYMSVSVQSIAIGRYMTAVDVGLYSRAYQLFVLPLQQFASPMTRVVLANLAPLWGTPRFSSRVDLLQRVCSYVLVPVLVVVALTSSSVLDFLMGPQWTAAANILSILAVGGVFQALGYVFYWAMLSSARTGTLLLCELPARLLIIVGSIVAAHHSVLAVASTFSAGLALIWAISLFFGMRAVGVCRAHLLSQVIRPIAMWLAGGALWLLIDQRLSSSSDFSSQPLLSIGACCLTMLGTMAFFMLAPPYRRDIASLCRIIVSLRTERIGSKKVRT